MIRTIDPLARPGQLFHAVLEGWIVAEISYETLLRMLLEPPSESRRGAGIPSVRASRGPASRRARAAR